VNLKRKEINISFFFRASNSFSAPSTPSSTSFTSRKTPSSTPKRSQPLADHPVAGHSVQKVTKRSDFESKILKIRPNFRRFLSLFRTKFEGPDGPELPLSGSLGPTWPRSTHFRKIYHVFGHLLF